MSGGTVNLTKWMHPQGIDPKVRYEATVTENNDPRKLCRVKARIEYLFDGIPDDDLPWAIPLFEHPDGSYNQNGKGVRGGKNIKRSGMFYVPKVDGKVILMFPEADAHYPVWVGYTLDDLTNLEENKDADDYPDVAGIRFRNGLYVIVNTKKNEVFFNSPGDLNITVLGDVHETILGNQTLKVASSKSDIPAYIKNAPKTDLEEIEGQQQKQVPWEGLLPPHQKGDQHFYVEGNQTMYIKGNRFIKIDGNNLEVVGGRSDIRVTKDMTIFAQHVYHN